MEHTPVRRLLAHPVVFEGESFHSFRGRLAIQNFYPNLASLDSFCRDLLREHGIKDSLDYPIHASTFTLLGQLMGVDCETLYLTTPHRFSPILTPPEKNYNFLTLPNGIQKEQLTVDSHRLHIRRPTSAQFCPKCIEEAAFHRVRWLPMVIAACLKHKVILIDRCPTCSHTFSINDVLKNRCACGIQLSTITPFDISKDMFGLQTQHLMQTWLMHEEPPAILSQMLALPEQPLRVLYRVVHGLRSCITTQNVSPEFIHIFEPISEEPSTSKLAKAELSSTAMYFSIATAVRALRNWPDGFYDLLEAQFGWKESYRDDSATALGPLLSHWLNRRWNHPDYGFIQNIFNEYMIQKQDVFPSITGWKRIHNGLSVNEKQYMTMAETINELGISYNVLDKLVRKNIIFSKNINQNKKNNHRFFDIQSIKLLKESLSDVIGMAEAAYLLRVSQKTIINLTNIGLLKRSETPRDTENKKFFFGKDIIQLIQDLLDQSDNTDSYTGQLIPLQKATYRMAPFGINGASLILFALQRKIRYNFIDATLGLRSILFFADDIENLRRQYLPPLITELLVAHPEKDFVLRYKIIEAAPRGVLSLTGLTKEQFEMIVTPFEQYFQEHVKYWTIRGERRKEERTQPSTGHRLETSQDRLLFVLCYLQYSITLSDYGAMFGLDPTCTGLWLNLLIRILKRSLEQFSDTFPQEIATIRARIGLNDGSTIPQSTLFVEISDDSAQEPRTKINRTAIVTARRNIAHLRETSS